MVMPLAAMSSRASITAVPWLFGPSPEMSMVLARAFQRVAFDQVGAETHGAADRRAFQ